MTRARRCGLLLLMVIASPTARAGLVKPSDAAIKAAPVPFPHGEWDALLKKYVDDSGRVDYAALKANLDDRARLERLFAAVAASSPTSAPNAYPTRFAQLAYYLDAYNVLVWKNVLDRLPKLKNIDSEKASFFFWTDFLVGGKKINLRDLEGDRIRPVFKDPRVHVGLNCASGGCPQLPREAFTPEKVDPQLDREARKFVGERRNVDYDAAAKKVRLSRLFDWYKADFGGAAKVLEWINRYRDDKLPLDAKIEYREYDWTLNDPSLKR